MNKEKMHRVIVCYILIAAALLLISCIITGCQSIAAHNWVVSSLVGVVLALFSGVIVGCAGVANDTVIEILNEEEEDI